MNDKQLARDVVKIIDENLRLRRENAQLRGDNKWLRSVLAVALEGRPAVVIRDDLLRDAPEIVQSENMGDELIITVRRR